MRILVVHNTYQQPGGEDVVVAQEKRLLELHGHQVVSYTRSNHELDQLSAFEKIGLIHRMVAASDSRADVRRLIRRHKPDVVHGHNTFFMVSPGVYEVCHDESVPVVQTLHNYRLLCPASTLYREGGICNECVTGNLLRSVAHRCYRNSHAMTGAVAIMLKTHRVRRTWNKQVSAFIALSEFQKRQFAHSGIPPAQMHVKPNFVAPDPGERIAAGDYALYVGRLSPEKGVPILLEAWQRLRAPVPLVIAGDGPLRKQLEKQCDRRELHHVRFAGRLARQEIYSAMKKAAFLIVPSVWHEPFGLIVAEAFACGTPVLGASVGAIPEMLEHGQNGLQFTPSDPDALATTVDWAWRHPQEMAAMGKAARHIYERRYTGDSNYQILMDVYSAAIQKRTECVLPHPISVGPSGIPQQQQA